MAGVPAATLSRPGSALRGWPAALALPFASGVLLWAASPAGGAGWVAWVALVPAAALALARAGTRAGRFALPLAYAVHLELLLVPALPFGLAEGLWGDPALPIMVRDSPVLFVALVALPLVGLLLYAAGFPWLGRGGAWGLVLVPALAWTALDFLRVKLDPSGYWGPLFQSQHDLPTARLAALGGPWLVTFALVAVNVGLAAALVRRRPAYAFPVLLLALALVPLPDGGGRTVRAAVVQPGYNTAELERPVLRHFRPELRNDLLGSLDLVRDLGVLTAEAAARGAEVVVWPEAVVWVDPLENGVLREALAALARSTGAAVVVPYFLRGPAHGATVVVGAGGSVSRPQPKQRPMWFLGEEGGNRLGTPRPVTTRAGALGTLLGVDNEDVAPARRLVAAGAELLASSTHDWPALASQQRALSRLHAVALARPLLRADWRFGSAIVDRDGSLRAVAPAGQVRAVLVAEVELGAGLTVAARVGDAAGWAALAALSVLVAGALARRWS